MHRLKWFIIVLMTFIITLLVLLQLTDVTTPINTSLIDERYQVTLVDCIDRQYYAVNIDNPKHICYVGDGIDKQTCMSESTISSAITYMHMMGKTMDGCTLFTNEPVTSKVKSDVIKLKNFRAFELLYNRNTLTIDVEKIH
jgi:hypothetical protein